MAAAIPPICTAANADAAPAELDAFEQGPWGRKFPTVVGAKLIWLLLRNNTSDWGRAAKDWKEAMNQFVIRYEDRFTKAST